MTVLFPPFVPGDKVEFTTFASDRAVGTVTQILNQRSMFIRYGRNDQSLAIFDIVKHDIKPICQTCDETKPDVDATEDPYLADVGNTPGVRAVLCTDCYNRRTADI